MPRIGRDLSGLRFGRLTVIEKSDVVKDGRHCWRCRCDCGTERILLAGNLLKGNTSSCGCYGREVSRSIRLTHGMWGTPERNLWNAMIQRCTNPRNTAFNRYGGRGITVCERWRQFENFIADMGRRPSPLHQLDRIDNDGPYDPSNCRWAVAEMQANNKQNNRVLTYAGQTYTLAQWAARMGVRPGAIQHRLSRGWTTEEALSRPVRRTPPAQKALSTP